MVSESLNSYIYNAPMTQLVGQAINRVHASIGFLINANNGIDMFHGVHADVKKIYKRK